MAAVIVQEEATQTIKEVLMDPYNNEFDNPLPQHMGLILIPPEIIFATF